MNFKMKLVRKPRRLRIRMGKYQNDQTPLREAGDHMREGVRPPVVTGELAEGIIVQRLKSRYRIISTARHSLFVEFGTSKMAPRPFLRTAFRERRDASKRKYIKALKRHKR